MRWLRFFLALEGAGTDVVSPHSRQRDMTARSCQKKQRRKKGNLLPRLLSVRGRHTSSVRSQRRYGAPRSAAALADARYARYRWVLPLYRYETRDHLIAAFGEKVIEPAERKALELHSGARPIPPIS